MKQLYSQISSALPTHPLRRFFGLISGEKRAIINIYLYAIVAGGIGLSLPLGIQAIINLVATGTITTSWFVLIVMVVGGYLIGGVLQILQLMISESIQQRIFVKSALELSFRIPRLDSMNLRRHYVPELVNRFFDTITVQKGLSKVLLDFGAASLQIIFGLILLSFYHPFFILFGFGLLLLLLLIIYLTGPMGLRTSLKESKFKYEVAHWLEEIGRKKDLFKGVMPGQASMKKTDDLTMNYLGARKGHFRILMMKYGVLLIFKLFIIAGLLIIGSLLVVENQLNLGQFVAAEIVIILIINSVEKIVLSVETIYDVLTGLEKIGYITDLPLEKENRDQDQDTSRGKTVRFEDFSLQFPEDRHPVLENISFSAGPGERVLIVDANEYARQSIVESIAGHYQHYDGSLTVGEVPIRNWNKNRLRSMLGVYRRADDLMDATIQENVTLLSGPVPLSEITHIAKSLGLNRFVENDPDGWDRKVGPDGMWLPDHIRPKVIMTRLLLANPCIIILSGLYTSVEQSTREQFLSYIRRECPDSAVIVLEANDVEAEEFDKVYHFADNGLLNKNQAQ